MSKRMITNSHISAFEKHLYSEERAQGTIDKYLRDVRSFAAFVKDQPITKELVAAWKNALELQTYAPVTINSMLAAVHSFFVFLGWDGCAVKYLKVQRSVFRDTNRELTREEYKRLIVSARTCGKERLALLMETICSTGIRVSEVRFFTVESVRTGRVEIALKGKIRTVLIPNKLARKLLKYAGKQKIASGEIFLTGSGRGMSRHQIWAEMKRVCKHADVESSKVFPHNLRHLFAVTFYQAYKDVVRLADVLGHSSIDTTRLYLITTGAEHARQLERLGLVI